MPVPTAQPPVLSVGVDYASKGLTRVALVGELDIASLGRLRRLLLAVLEDCGQVAVDLRGLRFVDLPGVRMLVEVSAVARRHQRAFELEGAGGQVARLIELTSARERLPLAASPDRRARRVRSTARARRRRAPPARSRTTGRSRPPVRC